MRYAPCALGINLSYVGLSVGVELFEPTASSTLLKNTIAFYLGCCLAYTSVEIVFVSLFRPGQLTVSLLFHVDHSRQESATKDAT